MVLWFHSFPEEPEVIIEARLLEQINVSAFRAASENHRAKKLFTGHFNEFIDFVSKEKSYSDVEIILPATEVLLTKVTVPSKSKNRIMQALPFILDENLINNIDKQHFALGNISSEQCNIAIISNYIFDTIYNQFKLLMLPVSNMSSEIFKLPWCQDKWSFAFLRENVLIRTGAQSGLAINVNNVDFVFRLLLNNSMPDEDHNSTSGLEDDTAAESNNEQHDAKTRIPDSIVIYAHENADNIKKITSIADEYLIETEVLKGSLLEFAIDDTSLLKGQQDTDLNGINLLQGKYHASNFKPVKIPFVKSLAAVFSLWLLTQIFFMGYQWTSTHNELNKLDEQLESLYFKTFPDSRRLIDMRVQTENQFNQLKKNSASNSSFLGLLGLVGEEIHPNKDIKINSLSYNDGVLQADIVSKGFIFNKLKSILKNKHNLIVEEKSSSRVAREVRSVLNFKANKF
ncbi:MAG: hypothetical protein LC437_04170 [Thiohalomonas sp.]|nr:hypothetical protein [Thiohalomonas sp.]